MGGVLNNLVNFIFNRIHPIGSYYWSNDPTSPSLLFGGTWEKVRGKFLFAEDNDHKAGSIGGEAAHTLTIKELPKHSHEFNRGAVQGSGYTSTELPYVRSNTIGGGAPPITKVIADTGASAPHNNMPPYEAAYCWKRTA